MHIQFDLCFWAELEILDSYFPKKFIERNDNNFRADVYCKELFLSSSTNDKNDDICLRKRDV